MGSSGQDVGGTKTTNPHLFNTKVQIGPNFY